jgi:hypothetical protein
MFLWYNLGLKLSPGSLLARNYWESWTRAPRNARYKAGHHDTCLCRAQQSFLDWIMRRADDPWERHALWLNGLAGIGKSTSVQTFSGIAAQNETLGASFFCSRYHLHRQELKNALPMTSYRLACNYPSFRTEIVRVIKRDAAVRGTKSTHFTTPGLDR